MKIKGLIIIFLIILTLSLGFFHLLRFARAAEAVAPADFAWLKRKLIAHRGLHHNERGIPENSIAAFQGAMEKGYIIELDVAMTKDKQLVVYHDRKLRRGLGIDQYLHELTYEELSQYRLFGTNETIPLFRDVLAFVDGKVPLLIEIKNEGKAGEMESLIYKELQEYQGEYAIQSFNPFTLNWFRQNAPAVLRGQLAGGFAVSDYDVEFAGTTRLPWYKRFLLENLLLNTVSRPHFISYEVAHASNTRLRRLKNLGVPLLGWTVRAKEEYHRVRENFDNLIVESFLEELNNVEAQ
ncbi:MAG TPA: glycerophosphodiester phosphodiesterase [Firmicutes bacterium]|nr:glycerophosphodiester phosphodiesterase [Bacillota bacterium]